MQLVWLVSRERRVKLRHPGAVPVHRDCATAVVTHFAAHQGSLHGVYKTSSIQPQTTTPQRKYRRTNVMGCFSRLWRRQRPASAHLRGVNVTRSTWVAWGYDASVFDSTSVLDAGGMKVRGG